MHHWCCFYRKWNTSIMMYIRMCVSIQCWAGAEMSVAELRTEWIETESCCRTPASVTCWRHVTSSTWTAADTSAVDISYRWTGECTNDSWYKDRQQLVHSVHVSIHLLAVFFYSTQFNAGTYLALPFYQPGKKIGQFFTPLVKKDS